ncbi:hypothetical protein SH668x_001257 [Planctomicrobium sp. SH668]|uniref:hypothetical protein n=1 Tax=Planctomicrobium sp. SH668 TaxID=3448126 RepID=UPI003F5B3351
MIRVYYQHDEGSSSLTLRTYRFEALIDTVEMELVAGSDRSHYWQAEFEANEYSVLHVTISDADEVVGSGEQSGLVDGAVIEIGSDDISSVLNGISQWQEEIDEHLDEQDTSLTDLCNDIAAVSAQVESVPSRVWGDEEALVLLDSISTIFDRVSALFMKLPIASWLAGSDRADGKVSFDAASINVNVGPVSARTPPDIHQSILYLRLDDTSKYRIEELKDARNQLVDLSGVERMDLFLERENKTQLEVIEDVERVNNGKGVAFHVSEKTVSEPTTDSTPHYWALRDPNDKGSDGVGRVLAGGPCYVKRYATRCDSI